MSVLFEIPHIFMPKAEWEKCLADPEQRGDALKFFADKLSRKFPFEEFQQIVSGFDERLNPGGLIVLMNANYRLMETDFAARYRPIIFPGKNIETMPKITRNYGVIDQDSFTEIVFRKLNNPA